jgi:diacylglycerol kinase family enzyme
MMPGSMSASRSGLIVNPRAGRGGGKGRALADRLAGDARVSVRVIERFGQLGGFLSGLAADGVTDLFVSSGDGTIQAILTELAERNPFPAPPRLCLLPHGTTNLSANDLGFRSSSLDAQASVLLAPEPRETSVRNTIRCANPGDGITRHGMFVGTGAVAEATRYCQQALNEQGVKGQFAVAATLLRSVGRHLISAPKPGDETRFDRPFMITVEADGRRQAEGTQLLQMSTTLSKLVLGARPFWGSGTGAIRTTVLPYPVPSVLRWILPVMYGGDNRATPPGAASFRSAELSVTSPSMFVIDGEFFPPPQGAALRLETGPAFTFIRA